MSSSKSDEEIIKIVRFANFNSTLADSKLLLELFRNRKKIIYPFKGVFDAGERSVNDHEAEALLRGALILCITAIEVYIESSIATKFRDTLITAEKTEDVKEAFNSAYASWIDKHRNHKKNEYDTAWANNAWKKTVFNKFSDDLKAFHNPTPKNIDKLFKCYGGFKGIIEKCTWEGVSLGAAKEKLEGIIELRGKVVHGGKKILGDDPPISEKDVDQAIDFSKNLIKCLEQIIFEAH